MWRLKSILLGRIKMSHSDGACVGLCCGTAEAGHDPHILSQLQRNNLERCWQILCPLWAVTTSTVLPVAFALSALVCVEVEESCLMEILLRNPVNQFFSLMFAQLESWWRFRQHLLKHWECVMCSTATAPACHGPSSQ